MSELSYNERISRGFSQIDQDLQTMLNCLSDVLKEVGMPDVAQQLPWGGGTIAVGSGFDQRHAQAYCLAFQLLNLVEESTAAHMRRVVETSNGVTHEPGLWGSRLAELKAEGWDGKALSEVLQLARVEPVLTAHPTESKRVTVIQRHADLYRMLAKRLSGEWTPLERELLDSELRTLIEILWRTGEIVIQKPTVDTERSAQLEYFEHVFPESLQRLDQRLRSAWKAAGFDPALLEDVSKLPRLRFGSWVGGDRDGHPLVTAAVTQRTLGELRAGALRQHRRELHALRGALSLSELLQPVPASLAALLSDLKALLPEGLGERLLSRNPHEPWRQVVTLIMARLPEPGQPVAAHQYPDARSLGADLRRLRTGLVDTGARRIAVERLDPLLRSIDVFGFHLATLDIRQNSTTHERAIDQILKHAGVADWEFSKWEESKRRSFLTEQLESPYLFQTPDFPEDTDAGRVLACYRVVAEHIRQHGTDGLGYLIVSMTRDVSDLLAVYFLARHGGLTEKRDGALACRLPVMPLFETFDDLVRAPAMVTDFLAHPVTRLTLGAPEASLGAGPYPKGWEPKCFCVMIGYSDSNKDSGMLAGSWALFKSQREISAAAAARGFRVRYFHGRGGTISRGAGPTHRFLEALPPKSVSFDFRLTEQGETIAQKYANIDTAVYHLESLLAGVTGVSSSQLANDSVHLLPEAAIIEQVVNLSRDAYRRLWDAEGFGTFHRQGTPIDVLEASRIGSRPSRRSGAATLADLRAIPWVFSWSQSRYFITGWYGAGTALARLRDASPSDFQKLGKAARENPFLKYALGNIETSVSSAEPEIMRQYAALVADTSLRSRILGMIETEYTLTLGMISELLGQERERRRPRLQNSLRRRNEALRPLHAYQIRLLREWRAAQAAGDKAAADSMLTGLLVSVNAIASGIRTTG